MCRSQRSTWTVYNEHTLEWTLDISIIKKSSGYRCFWFNDQVISQKENKVSFKLSTETEVKEAEKQSALTNETSDQHAAV